MEECKVKNLYNLEETIAKDLLETVTYPWEALPKIADFIIELGKSLDKEKYEEEIAYEIELEKATNRTRALQSIKSSLETCEKQQENFFAQ